MESLMEKKIDDMEAFSNFHDHVQWGRHPKPSDYYAVNAEWGRRPARRVSDDFDGAVCLVCGSG